MWEELSVRFNRKSDTRSLRLEMSSMNISANKGVHPIWQEVCSSNIMAILCVPQTECFKIEPAHRWRSLDRHMIVDIDIIMIVFSIKLRVSYGQSVSIIVELSRAALCSITWASLKNSQLIFAPMRKKMREKAAEIRITNMTHIMGMNCRVICAIFET